MMIDERLLKVIFEDGGISKAFFECRGGEIKGEYIWVFVPHSGPQILSSFRRIIQENDSFPIERVFKSLNAKFYLDEYEWLFNFDPNTSNGVEYVFNLFYIFCLDSLGKENAYEKMITRVERLDDLSDEIQIESQMKEWI